MFCALTYYLVCHLLNMLLLLPGDLTDLVLEFTGYLPMQWSTHVRVCREWYNYFHTESVLNQVHFIFLATHSRWELGSVLSDAIHHLTIKYRDVCICGRTGCQPAIRADALQNASQLRSLHIINHSLSREMLHFQLPPCPLECLRLTCCSFDDSFLSPICSSPVFARTLRNLSIDWLDISQDQNEANAYCLEKISHLTGLERLMLAWCQLNDQVAAVLSSLSYLREVALRVCPGLTDTGLGAVLQLPALYTLRLHHCPLIQFGSALAATCARAAQLHTLQVSECTNIPSVGFGVLGSCPNLRELSLSGRNVCDGALRSLVGSSLQHLTLGNCPSVSDAGISELRALSRLVYLYVSGCSDLTGSCLHALNHHPNLDLVKGYPFRRFCVLQTTFSFSIE